MSAKTRYVTGVGKILLYGRIAIHVASHYLLRPTAFQWNPLALARFLYRALPVVACIPPK